MRSLKSLLKDLTKPLFSHVSIEPIRRQLRHQHNIVIMHDRKVTRFNLYMGFPQIQGSRLKDQILIRLQISWNTDIPEKMYESQNYSHELDVTNASADVFPLIERIVSSLLPLSSPPLSLSFFKKFFQGGRAPGAPPPESAPDYSIFFYSVKNPTLSGATAFRINKFL